jgi:hypothetical protein
MGNMWHKTRDMHFIMVCPSGETSIDNASAKSKGGPKSANDKRLNSCLPKILDFWPQSITVIPRLTKIIRSEIAFVNRKVMLSGVSLLAVSNINNPVGLVGLPYVMCSAHLFVTHIQTEKISSWNGPTVHVCCFMVDSASTKTFVSRIHIR